MTETKQEEGARIAVVLVRGLVDVKGEVKDTLRMLGLTRKNQCVVIDGTNINLGMLRKVKDYVTWGSLDQGTFDELLQKRGRELLRQTDTKKKYDYRSLNVAGKNYHATFSLSPPRKGFGRKGIKLAFKVGGALGDRKEKMNDLIKRML